MKTISLNVRFAAFALASLVLSFAVFSGAACSSTGAVKAHIERGEAYLAERQFQEASLEFRSAIELDKNSAAAHFGLARAFEGQERFSETVEELRKAVELDKTNAETRVKLGNYLLLAQLPQHEQVEKLVREIFAINADHIEGHVLQASLMAVKNHATSEIVALLEKAVSLDPRRIETYLSLARFYTSRQKNPEAEKTFERAFAVNEKSALAHIEFARYLDAQNRASEAEKHYLRATEVEPATREPLEALAGFYFARQELAKAEETYQKLANLNPNRPEDKTLLADFYSAVDRADDALKIYGEILTAKPEFVRARARLGEIHLQNNRTDAASEQVTEILSRNSKDVQGLTLRARIALKTGEAENAIKNLQEALKQEPGNRLALYYMADAQLRAGEFDQARSFVAELERYHPEYFHARLLNAQISFNAGEPENAWRQSDDLLKELEKAAPSREISAATLKELRVNALLARATANLQLGREPAARADLTAAQAVAPNSSGVFLSLASAARRGKYPAEAAAFYEKVLQLDANNFDALSGFVAAKIRQKDFAAAHAQVERAIQSGGRGKIQAALLYLKAQIFSAENKLAEAENALQQSIALNADYLPAYQAYAGLFVGQNQIDRAIEKYRQILERSPTNDEALTLIGMLEESRGNVDLAMENYREALKANPNAAIAANNLAWLIADTGRGNLDEALALANNLVGKYQNEPAFADTLGWVFHKKGNREMAIAQIRRAVALEEKAAVERGTAPSSIYKNRLASLTGATNAARASL